MLGSDLLSHGGLFHNIADVDLVTDRHAAIDYTYALEDLSDTHFRDAAKIVLVPSAKVAGYPCGGLLLRK
jgi:hypothetical protein